MRFSVSKRALLIGAGAAAGVGALGLGFVGFSSKEMLVVELLKRALPGVAIDEASALVCAQDVLTALDGRLDPRDYAVSAFKLKAVRAASQVAGLQTISNLPPLADRLEEIERAVVTQFLMNSGYFYRSAGDASPLFYERPDPNAACANPFATLVSSDR